MLGKDLRRVSPVISPSLGGFGNPDLPSPIGATNSVSAANRAAHQMRWATA